MPTSLLGWVARSDCAPGYSSTFATWEFPCGLCISDEVVAQPGMIPVLVAQVHDMHHSHMKDMSNWSLICHVETGKGWRKETVRCDCGQG